MLPSAEALGIAAPKLDFGDVVRGIQKEIEAEALGAQV
jgi:hypothetical protein